MFFIPPLISQHVLLLLLLPRFNQPLHPSVARVSLCVSVSHTQARTPKSLRHHCLTATFSHHTAEWKDELPAALGAEGENTLGRK